MIHRYCSTHGIVTQDHHCRGRWPNGSTRQWRKQRARILNRDPHCHCGKPSTEVHHLTEGTAQVVPDHQLRGVCHGHNPRGGSDRFF